MEMLLPVHYHDDVMSIVRDMFLLILMIVVLDHRDVHPFCWRSVVLSQESRHGGGGFRLSSLRKSAIVAGLRGRHRLLRAVGDVSALRATDLQVFVSFESSLLLID